MKYLYAAILLTVTISFDVIANEKISFATVDFPPFYAKELPNGGYICEITREAFKRVGYDFEITFLPWARAVELAKNNKYDGLLAAYYTDERNTYFMYTDKIEEIRFCFFARKNSGINYNKLSDIYSYTVGTVNGYAYPDEFEKDKKIKKEYVSRFELNLRKLLSKRIDLIIEDENVTFYEAKKINVEDMIEKVGKPISFTPFYNAISRKKKGFGKIVTDFNRGLELIKKDGTYDRIRERARARLIQK